MDDQCTIKVIISQILYPANQSEILKIILVENGWQIIDGVVLEYLGIVNMNETTFEHIDQFIDDPYTDQYASWFFHLHRLPATLQGKFKKYIEKYKLYCIYKSENYQVVGCSRLGDVWLKTINTSSTSFYDLRVSINECSEFTNNIQ